MNCFRVVHLINAPFFFASRFHLQHETVDVLEQCKWSFINLYIINFNNWKCACMCILLAHSKTNTRWIIKCFRELYSCLLNCRFLRCSRVMLVWWEFCATISIPTQQISKSFSWTFRHSQLAPENMQNISY